MYENLNGLQLLGNLKTFYLNGFLKVFLCCLQLFIITPRSEIRNISDRLKAAVFFAKQKIDETASATVT